MITSFQDVKQVRLLDRNKQSYLKTLFNKTRQDNIQIFNKMFFFRYRTKALKATEMAA